MTTCSYCNSDISQIINYNTQYCGEVCHTLHCLEGELKNERTVTWNYTK